MENRLKSLQDRADALKKEKKAIMDELERLKREIEDLENALGQDEDGDGLPDESAASEAAVLASLLAAGEMVDVCIPATDWSAMVDDLASQNPVEDASAQDLVLGGVESFVPSD